MAAKKSIPKISAKQRGVVSRPATPRPAATRKSLTNTFLPGFWSQHRQAVLALLALAFALYAMSIGFGYLVDDQLVIFDNSYVQKGLAGLRDIFAHDSFMGYFKQENYLLEGGRYRPLSLATFAAEVSIFGKNQPGIGHFINILLYGITGILLYRILLGLFPIKEGGKWFFSLPFLSAAIFVLHPLHVEAVANIKGRDEILSLLGSLGALYASLKYFDTDKKRWLLWASVFLFLGLLAKENAITFLAVIPLTLWLLAKVPANRLRSIMIPLLAVTLLFIFMRYKALGFMLSHEKPIEDLMNNPFLGMTGSEKFATIFLTLGWYLNLLVFPHPLTHDYYPYHVPKASWSDWRVGVSLALYAAIAIWAAWRVFKKSNAEVAESDTRHLIPAYSILYFLLTMSIVSNIFVNVGAFMNERFAYMPSVGFCLIAGWFFAQKLPEWLGFQADKPYWIGIGFVSILAILFGIRTWTRVQDWSGKGLGLINTAIQVGPNSCRAQYYYASMLYYERYVKIPDATAEKNALADTIEQHLNRALEIYPEYRLPSVIKASLAATRFQQDKDLKKLLSEYEFLMRKQPYNGDMLRQICDFTKAIKSPDPEVYNSFCHRIGYEFYGQQHKDLNGALEFLNYPLNLRIENEQILTDLASIYTQMGNAAKAAEIQQRLIALRQTKGI